MKTRTRGFTLIDLVVVILCVTILITLSACIDPRGDYGHPAACGQNLNGIGKAIALYRGEHENSEFPLLFTSGQPEANIRAADAGKSLDELRTNLVGREAAMQNVWMIIDKGLVTEDAFKCPFDRDFESREFETAAQRKAKKVGWQSSANFSYGMHFPYKSTTIKGDEISNEAWLGDQLKGSFVIMADKSPSRTNEPAVGVGPDKTPSNHREVGQAYLMFSGAAGWKKSTEDSKVNGDDIYTIQKENNAYPATPANMDDQYITRHPMDD
jgi:hypothetical protein